MAKGKSASKTEVTALERSASHLLHCALQLALDHYGAAVGAAGLTQRQFAVLAAARAREGATQTDLVRLTGIDRSTLADIAARMIQKGLLARERSALDGRANLVRLTDAGREVLAKALPLVEAADARLMKRISGGKRRAAFLDMLRELKAVEPDPAAQALKAAKKAAKLGKEAAKRERKAA